MTNKYLEKIAESDLRALGYMDKAVIQAKARADGADKAHTSGAIGGTIGGVAGHFVGKSYGHAGRGAILGAAALGYMNYKGGLAQGHHESLAKSHNAMKKQAQSEHLKDIKDTATIAGLGSLGGMLGNKLLGHKGAFNMKAALIGGGVGLAADYAGLKLNKVTDKLLPQNNKKDTNVPL